ncbi:tyrosine-type recombinase/integrase, partial [Streptosporangium sp. NPDC020072]|uniref:tyrosine-type recombinase/integrase n=1 Tax=Streptosporangium sp. NPDC020072 TaxID=3154788 RepID=UPI003443A288
GAFVAWLARDGKAPSTIGRRVAGVTVTLRERGVEVPKLVTKKTTELLNAYQRELDEAGEQRGRGEAPLVSKRELRRLSEACPDTLAGLRDRAALLVGFGIAARSAEMAGLLARDITEHEEGLTVHVRYGKTGARKVAISRGSHPLTDAVTHWQIWQETARLVPGGPAFLQIGRYDNPRGKMSAQAFNFMLSRACERAGVSPKTWHGLRSGLATEARAEGHGLEVIAAQGGWKFNSRVLANYLRNTDQWRKNATKGVM